MYVATTSLLVATGNPKGLTDYASVADGDARLAVMNGAVEVDQAKSSGVPDDRLQIVADQVGGPTPARAVAAACSKIAAALVEDPSRAGTYHLSGAPDVSWSAFAREIFLQAGRSVGIEEISTRDYPTPARRPLNSRLDCRATEAAFGISRPDWRAALSDVLEELRMAA